ncbi:unnamed protein product, partial [Brachionus calyciflorus]
MSGNFQEDFQFLLKNLSDKNENILTEDELEENFSRTKYALVNVINIYITEFDKKYDSVLTPLFHMIELYIKQYSELFITNDDLVMNDKKTLKNNAKEFTNFLMSRMLLILSNPDIKSLHSYSCKIIILILETFSLQSQYDFFLLISELILTLDDLMDFDKAFYDRNETDSKVLNRFSHGESDSEQLEKESGLVVSKKQIIIESPTNCLYLQDNITFILKEVCIQFVNVVHDELYEKLWLVLCEQLKYGERSLKITTYNLILCILDIRILPLNRFDMANELYLYFMDCLFATVELLLAEQNEKFDSNPESLNMSNSNKDLELVVSMLISRIFDANTKLISNRIDMDNFLIHLISLVKNANFNKCTLTCNSTFSMILNLVKAKLQTNENKYLDICILNDLADCLSENIGKLNQVNQYLNMIIAQALIYEIEINHIKPSAEILTLNIDKSNNSNELFKFDLNFDKIQTKLYKKLTTKAKELLISIRKIQLNNE